MSNVVLVHIQVLHWLNYPLGSLGRFANINANTEPKTGGKSRIANILNSAHLIYFIPALDHHYRCKICPDRDQNSGEDPGKDYLRTYHADWK